MCLSMLERSEAVTRNTKNISVDPANLSRKTCGEESIDGNFFENERGLILRMSLVSLSLSTL